ncbi:MAG TPA: EAL domain-containing protein [Steroidobacteraceae bacterium]|nr:EAL domain-containing protein [Steroidobacteraceae bacterium]
MQSYGMRAAASWRPFLLFLVGLAFVQPAVGSAVEQSRAVFEHLTTADGLPQGTVNAVLQDSQGFVWIGTQDGLVRYDGHRLFRYGYKRGAIDALPGDWVQAIAEDAHHDLWIAVADGGLARWNRDADRFTVFRHEAGVPGSLASDAVVALLIDDAGRVWVGTRDSGLDIFDPRTGHIEHLQHDPMRADSLSDDRIKALTRGPDGVIWVGTDLGVDRLLPGSRSFLHCPAAPEQRKSSSQVLSLYADPSGTVWQGVPDGGLLRRDSSGRITRHFQHVAGSPSSLANDSIRAILQDRDGHLWLGTEAGLDMLDATTGQFMHYRHQDGDTSSLSDSYIISLYQDPHGLLWVGTAQGGVDRWNPRSWNFGSHRPKWLEDRLVTAFADAGDDRVWVASMGGLVRFNPRTGEHEDIDEILGRHAALGDSRVTSLELDAAGTLWIGTMSAGVSSLSPDGRLRTFGVSPGSDRALSAPGIMSLYAARDGRIWIGTHGGGADVLDPGSGRVVQLPFGSGVSGALSSGNITGFAEDPTGPMWIATADGGLDLADSVGHVLRVFRHLDHEATSLPGNILGGVTVDPSGRVWAATNDGLARVLGSPAHPDGIHFQIFGRAEGLAGDVVYGIVPDASGALWMSGNSGLTRYDPDTGSFRTYHVQNGLQGEEFVMGAYRRLRSGQLAFGGPGGFNLFDPQSIDDTRVPPRVALMQVDVIGAPLKSSRPYWLLDQIHVDASARIITLEFAALDFVSPAHNRLSYRLPNFSDRWIDLGTEHDVTLTNLGAGDHVLEVRAASADSGWGNSPLRITIHKDPPFWASLPAKLAYLTLALALVAVAWRVRMRRRAQAEHIKRLAYYDPLTGLPNRQQCLDTASEMISRAAAAHETVSFVYLDLNGFKRINDTFGHTVGDDVLRIVAQKLNQAISIHKTANNPVVLSRFGGDEFVVLVHNRTPGLGLEVARACHAMLGAPINYEPAEFFTIPSVGVAVFPEDGADVETVLKHADTAMYHAKSTGTGGVEAYSPAMSSRLRKAMRLESRLRRALRAELLTVEYQPKFRLTDQGLIGAEVLSRWHDDELGDVSPGEFIAIAEESSLIIELGEWVIRASCRQLRAWADADISLPLAVNVSGKELLHGNPARTLEHEARAAGISPSLIEIEITESLLVRESAAVRTALDRLRDLGCLISLDDFGTGYSSLAYITRFPPDKIKVDKSFVQNVDHSVTDAAIVTAILSLGESLHLTTTAEGIERKTQLEWLRSRGCHEGQGFYLSRPLTSLRLQERFLQGDTLKRAIKAIGS